MKEIFDIFKFLSWGLFKSKIEVENDVSTVEGLFELKLFATDLPRFLFNDIDLFILSFFIILLLFKYVFKIF